jgi:hypothetical protein
MAGGLCDENRLIEALIGIINCRYGPTIPHEMVSIDEEIEKDSTPSVHLDATQQTASVNKRKRRAPIQSFDDRFNDLMAFRAKYGNCDVSQHGEDPSLGN